MRSFSLTPIKKDKQWIESNIIDLKYISNFLTGLVNQIRPSKKRFSYKLKVAIVDTDYSYYDFTDTLHIAKKNSNFKGKKQKIRIIEDIFHEFFHFVQYRIDNVPIGKFAVDHEEVSFTSYFKNKTEIQARTFSRFSKECIESFSKTRKMKRHLIKII